MQSLKKEQGWKLDRVMMIITSKEASTRGRSGEAVGAGGCRARSQDLRWLLGGESWQGFLGVEEWQAAHSPAHWDESQKSYDGC